MKIPKKAFDLPLFHRFIFVPKNTSLYAAPVIQISSSIKSVERAYKIAVELLKELDPNFDDMCAVFYGHVSDFAYEEYASLSFYTIKKFKKRFKLDICNLQEMT